MNRSVALRIAVVGLVPLIWVFGFAPVSEWWTGSLRAAQVPTGTYQLDAASETEAWRIDVRTGEVWVCRSPGTDVVCYEARQEGRAESTYQIRAHGAGAAWLLDTATGDVWSCRAPGTEAVCYSEP